MTATRRARAGETHKWEFKARFRRKGFGWTSQPAITRIRQAVAEIKKVAKKDALLAAEAAVVFLERVSPALEAVDSSSGSIGDLVKTTPGDEGKWFAAATDRPLPRRARAREPHRV